MIWLLPLVAAAVLLPVVAFIGARRLPPPKNRGPARGDVYWQVAQKFNLVGSDYTEVENAVREGRAAPPRLQPAAHAMAETWLHQMQRFSTLTKSTRVLVIAFGSICAIGAIGAIIRGRGIPIVLPVLWLPFWLVTHRKTSALLSNIRRAIELNRPDGESVS